MNLPSLTKEQGLLWGESLVNDSNSKNLEKINVRRTLVALEKFVSEALSKKLFVDSKIDQLSIFQRPDMQEQLAEYEGYLDLIMRKAKDAGYIQEFTRHTKGFVESFVHKRDGTIVVTWHDGSTQEMSNWKYKPRRKARVWAKQAKRCTIGFDTTVKPIVSVNYVELNLVLTKQGADFSQTKGVEPC